MLSDVEIRNTKPKLKPFKLADSNQLYLVITPKGSTLWRMKYVFDSKEKTQSFGPYPLIGLSLARQIRDDARKLLLDGVDPAAAKRQRVQASIDSSRLTFAVVPTEWFELNRTKWLIVYHRWENKAGSGPYNDDRRVAIQTITYDKLGQINPIDIGN